MTAVPASLCCILLLFACVFANQKTITAESGQAVTLPCRAQNNFIVVDWSRADLDKENYVFLYQDGRFDSDNQDPSFKNRVELQDKEMRDGDVSVILKDVTSADSGKYECRTAGKKRAILDSEPISIINLTVVPPDQKNIPAESGQNITLTCRAPNNNNIIVVEWIRPDLKPEYVFVYRNKNFDAEHQHPFFKDRVDLQDRQMKDGDVSLILKDVTINDSGTYECRVFVEETNSWKLINTTSLSVVVPPGQPGGHREGGGKEDAAMEDVSVRMAIGLVVVLHVIVGGAALLCHKKMKKH